MWFAAGKKSRLLNKIPARNLLIRVIEVFADFSWNNKKVQENQTNLLRLRHEGSFHNIENINFIF